MKDDRTTTKPSGGTEADDAPVLASSASPEPTTFVLISTQRSGSTWVIDTLNSHPRVVAYSELFLQGAQGRPRWGGARGVEFWNTFARGRRTHRRRGSRVERLREYLQYVLDRSDAAAVGFKLMYGQAGAYPELLPLLAERGGRILHLVRRNGLDAVLSRETAWASQQFHARHGERVSHVRLHLEPAEIVGKIRNYQKEIERGDTLLAQFGLRTLDVSYEDLCSGRTSFRQLLNFLDVRADDFPLTSTLRKLNPPERRLILENYDEVARALEATGLGYLLD